MKLVHSLVVLLIISGSGCGTSEPTLTATWTDPEDRVFVEFSDNEIFLGEKAMKLRYACGTYRYTEPDNIEITFNEMGKRVRKFAKDPKKGVSIIHDAFASDAEQEKFQDVVRISVKLKNNSLEIQPVGKPAVTWKHGKPFKI